VVVGVKRVFSSAGNLEKNHRAEPSGTFPRREFAGSPLDRSTSLEMTLSMMTVQKTRRTDVSLSFDEVRRIYDELAARPAERQCLRRTECCQFTLTGLIPYLTKGEALVAARAWRATGRKNLPDNENGACPMLDSQSGKCLIYAHRPFGCRTHFCAAAGGPLARTGVLDLIRRLETLDAQLGGDGPRRLPGAVAAALREIA